MSDATLLKLEAEFHAIRVREEKAADRRAELDHEIDRLGALIRKVEQKVDRRTEQARLLFNKMMETRAKSVEGMLAKVRVRESWAGDDDATERKVLQSLIDDLRAIGEAQS